MTKRVGVRLSILVVVKGIHIRYFNVVKHFGLQLNFIQNTAHVAFKNYQLAIRKIKHMEQVAKIRYRSWLPVIKIVSIVNIVTEKLNRRKCFGLEEALVIDKFSHEIRMAFS